MTGRNTNDSLCCVSSGCCVPCSFGAVLPQTHIVSSHTCPDQFSAEGMSEADLQSLLSGRPPLLWLCPENSGCLSSIDFCSISLAQGDQVPPGFLFLHRSQKTLQTGSWDSQRLTPRGISSLRVTVLHCLLFNVWNPLFHIFCIVF